MFPILANALQPVEVPLPEESPAAEDLAPFANPVDEMAPTPVVAENIPKGVSFNWAVLRAETQEEYDAKPPEIQHLIHEIQDLGTLPSQEWAANRVIEIQKEIAARNSPKAQTELAISQNTLAQTEAEREKTEREKQESLNRASNEYKRMIDLIEKLKTHPGREWATGGSSMLPKMRGTAPYDFQVLLDQVRGKQFLAGFQSLKGGGPVTDLEGAKAEAAIARTDPGQSEGEFTAGLEDFKNFLTEEYNTTLSRFGVAPQTPPQPSDPFEPGKRYKDAGGNVRTYKGNGAWE